MFMNCLQTNSKRVLAIAPKPRGFGFAILESPTTIVDWGVKATRHEKEALTLAKVAELIRHYSPQVLVFEDCRKSRRCPRVRGLLDHIRNLAIHKGVKPRSLAASRVREVFLSFQARTKHQIAQVIAQQLPELASRLPRYRKPWMSEDYRMAIFDAAALALTYFYTRPVRAHKTREPSSR
jgi:hypothetical protein